MFRAMFHWSLCGALLLAGGWAVCAVRADIPPQPLDGPALPPMRRPSCAQNCFKCHGEDPKNIKGDGLKVLDHAYLVQKDRKIVVPGDPDASNLILQVESERMPPGNKLPKVSQADRQVLRDWIAAGAPPFPPTQPSTETGGGQGGGADGATAGRPAAPAPEELAAQHQGDLSRSLL